MDSSVLLRIVLGQRNRLREWQRSQRWLSCELIRLECLRTLDRARIRFGLPDAEIAQRCASVLETLRAFDLVRLGPNILERAAEPFPTVLGTLDALHLSSALALRSRVPDLVFATHDQELAIAATAVGFRVLGCSLPR